MVVVICLLFFFVICKDIIYLKFVGDGFDSVLKILFWFICEFVNWWDVLLGVDFFVCLGLWFMENWLWI